MSGLDDSFVLVGERKSLPKLHVENEETTGTLRFRSTSSSPVADGSSKVGTPGFGSPGTLTSVFTHSTKNRTSPTLKDLKEGLVDSGYGGERWRDSTSVKKQLSFAADDCTELNRSLWEAVASPVLNLKNSIQGRPSFLDDGSSKKGKMQPQYILAGIVMMILVSSLCFAILIGINHFDFQKDPRQNGKMKSILYGTEKKLDGLREAGRLIDSDILDESGSVLGGKRAAIQYAHQTQDAAAVKEGAGAETKKHIIIDHLDLFELSASMEKMSNMIQLNREQDGEILEKVVENLELMEQQLEKVEEKLLDVEDKLGGVENQGVKDTSVNSVKEAPGNGVNEVAEEIPEPVDQQAPDSIVFSEKKRSADDSPSSLKRGEIIRLRDDESIEIRGKRDNERKDETFRFRLHGN